MPAFLLTWKESGWHENIVELLDRFDRLGHVKTRWRIHAHRMAKSGDRVWILKQGRGPKGIFGVGTIAGKPKMNEAGSGKSR